MLSRGENSCNVVLPVKEKQIKERWMDSIQGQYFTFSRLSTVKGLSKTRLSGVKNAIKHGFAFLIFS